MAVPTQKCRYTYDNQEGGFNLLRFTLDIDWVVGVLLE